MGALIEVNGLEVYAYHGVLPEEKVIGQPFVFDIRLTLEECSGCRSDRVEDTVDYGEVVEVICATATSRSYNLLEALARTVADAIMENFPVDRAEVRVRKPRPPDPPPPGVRGCCRGGCQVVEAHMTMPDPETPQERSRVFLGLGSNEGESRRTLARTIEELDGLEETRVVAYSHLYETAPVGFEEQADFLNLVVEIETGLDPCGLLSSLHRLERDAGRVRTENRWGPRPLDVDILWYDGRTLHLDRLELPHPRMTERRFVLEPLAELAPELELPNGATVEDALKQVEDQRVMRREMLDLRA